MTGQFPKTALITGAAKRIGRALSLDLARQGYDIALHCNSSKSDAETLAAEIRDLGRRACVVSADLTNEEDTHRLVADAVKQLGPIGVLINNASTFEFDDVGSATRDSWDLHMETNLRAPFVLSQQFARHLPDDCKGAILNLIDQRVWNLTPHFMTYTLSKAGLWTLTQTLSLALAPKIRVNAIGPGPALPSSRQTQEDFDAQCAKTPLKIGTNPQEICDAVRFFLAAPAITGQMLALDGGQHLDWAPSGEEDKPVE
ncbi:SDR family oxidoreductase [Thalassospira sp.]|uniref:SDR family oxidoreductase n=1 Tax=Thalassospira sp. TaxID=1912094 RepID=UPI001B0EE6BC|nr:SDR family oxidoreductase [Thalassospira sp.]MBO6806160.1 SDR family oxidoreductase [Thalassospira sp.]MBO6840633.1 SDR family oxidoreductase [Thalassospira sp.]MBR9899165.1 SDR family oxidoreductase [Rhodospirillales bacterium]